jgi:hypothetical protein
MTRWKQLATCADGEPLEIDGISVWKHEWVAKKDERVTVTHYGRPFEINVWEIRTGDRTVVFAAGEYSNGVWGFYIPEVTKS